MTVTRYEVDVVDRGGRIGRELWIANGAATVTPPPGVDRTESVRRPGFVVPGLHDAHLHLGSITAATVGVSLEGALDLDDVSRGIAAHGAGDIVAIAFDETDMDPPRLLEAADLDAMVEDRAVLVYRVCGPIAMALSLIHI